VLRHPEDEKTVSVRLAVFHILSQVPGYPARESSPRKKHCH
jgi:hypothetical protein